MDDSLCQVFFEHPVQRKSMILQSFHVYKYLEEQNGNYSLYKKAYLYFPKEAVRYFFNGHYSYLPYLF